MRYWDAGKKQLYLDRKDDPDHINPANLLNGTSTLDERMGAELKKYVDGVLICVKYMDKKNRKACITKRYSKMNEPSSKLKSNGMY